jgi:hypothetical protein
MRVLVSLAWELTRTLAQHQPILYIRPNMCNAWMSHLLTADRQTTRTEEKIPLVDGVVVAGTPLGILHMCGGLMP